MKHLKDLNLLKEINKYEIRIGLPEHRLHGPSGLPLAQLGAIHEFGLGDMPERSFLRAWKHAEEKTIQGKQEKLIKAITSGRMNPAQAAEKLAIWAEGQVKEFISAGNARAKNETITDHTPLIDTGALRQAITGIVVKK